MTHEFNVPSDTIQQARIIARSLPDPEDSVLFEMSLVSDCPGFERVATAMKFWNHLEAPGPPAFPSDESVAFRLKLVIEEFKEMLADGFGIQAHITFTDTHQENDAVDWENPDGYWRVEHIEEALGMTKRENWNLVEAADGIGDMKYVLNGMAVNFRIPQNLVDWEIHCSNMTKFGPGGELIMNGVTPGYCEGEPGYRHDEPKLKVLKPATYVRPNLARIMGLTQEGE